MPEPIFSLIQQPERGYAPRVKVITCIGAGYVGGPTCSVIAYKCPHIKVNVVDISSQRIDAWNSSNLPIYEPGLAEIVESCRGKNLFFTTNIDEAIIESDLIFVSVNTPTKTNGEGAGRAANLQFVEEATRRIAFLAQKDVIIVEKSTVPCRTSESMRQILLATSPKPGIHFEILSNPEFLAEGTAIRDLLCPDRILIGAPDTCQGRAAQDALAEVYSFWVDGSAIIKTGLWSSELSKLAANAMLAQRVSSINALAAICDATGANVDEVAMACGKDKRIGNYFLKAGVGFGGSCFPKDIKSLCYLAESLGLQEVSDYWNQVMVMNDWTKKRFTQNVVKSMFSTISGKSVALLGFAFKANTGDIREAPAIDIAKGLISEGAKVHIFDPKVSQSAITQSIGEDNVEIYQTLEESAKGCSAICILTEWAEFRSKQVNWANIWKSMVKPAFVFDGRGVVDRKLLEAIGFQVQSLGRA